MWMNIAVHSKEGNPTSLIEIEGRVDSATAYQISEQTREVEAIKNCLLLVDLTHADYVSSLGLRELVALLRRTRQNDGETKLIVEADPNDPNQPKLNNRVMEVIDLAGLNSMFEILTPELASPLLIGLIDPEAASTDQ